MASTAEEIKRAEDVVATDLAHITSQASEAFDLLSGKKLLLVGGAGFLGHYMVQAVVYWNGLGKGAPISLTVYDNWSRGVPDWLKAHEGDKN
ncbi:MAG TPA: hypothetical protein VGA68_04395, partial [Woeseiaceae bacterium]